MDATRGALAEPLAVTASREGNWTFIAVSGELALGTAELLDAAIRNAEAGAGTIVVDLRELSFMDSTGLSLLLSARKRSDRIRFIPSKHDAVARLIALSGTEESLLTRSGAGSGAPLPMPSS